MSSVIRAVMAWFVGSAVATAVAIVVCTQFVLAEVTAMGLTVPLDVRLSASLHDLAGMSPLYGTIIAVGFAIAMPVGVGTRSLLDGRGVRVQPIVAGALAGAAAIGTALILVNEVTGITAVAGARSNAGFVCQVLSGAVGGCAFAAVHQQRTQPQ